MIETAAVTKKRPIYLFLIWTTQHPMVFASIIILITSAIGYVYESTLFSAFDINIFRFSSVYDFMYQWWRQWAVVSHFLLFLLMLAAMITGYFVTAFVIDNLGKYRKQAGKKSLEEIFIISRGRAATSRLFIFIVTLAILVFVSYLVVGINEDALTGKGVFIAVIYSLLYGVVSFATVWIIQNIIINDCHIPIWRWTGISLLFIGVMYLFVMLLLNIADLARTEANLIKGDTKYTYTVIRNAGDSEVVVTRNAKILSITTYYHLFYVRESGKIVAISNQFVGSIESNWVR